MPIAVGTPRWARVVLTLVAAGSLVVGCGDPNAGDAAEVELQEFLRAHPVEGYEAASVTGQNDLPFSGTLDVTMSASDPDALVGLGVEDYLAEMETVSAQLCRFDPEADVVVELGYQVGSYAVPMSCPGDQAAATRLADQAALLVDLMALDGLTDVDATGGSIQARTAGALDRVGAAAARTRLEAIARRHEAAFGDREPLVTVGGAPGTPDAPTATPK
jgi:hypothetical protein